MKIIYVYILLCADNSYYTGVTNDPDLRVQQHNEGLNTKTYTYTRRPVKLVFHEAFQNPEQAISFEKQLKGWSKKKKEALIQNNWNSLPELSKCQNKTHSNNFTERSK